MLGTWIDLGVFEHHSRQSCPDRRRDTRVGCLIHMTLSLALRHGMLGRMGRVLVLFCDLIRRGLRLLNFAASLEDSKCLSKVLLRLAEGQPQGKKGFISTSWFFGRFDAELMSSGLA